MDQIDRANDIADLERTIALRNAAATAPAAEPTGACLNCGAKLKRGRRWCDAECREDWEIRECRKR